MQFGVILTPISTLLIVYKPKFVPRLKFKNYALKSKNNSSQKLSYCCNIQNSKNDTSSSTDTERPNLKKDNELINIIREIVVNYNVDSWYFKENKRQVLWYYRWHNGIFGWQ